MTDVSAAVLEACREYDWPGNIRELQNVIERAVLIEESSTLKLDSLPAHIRDLQSVNREELLSLSEIERRHIEKILQYTHRNISKSSRILGIDRKTLYDKIKKYNIL